jgi:hypothetical protein
MNNGYQKSNGCGADKEGGEFFKTFFFTKLQSKHVRPLAYNVLRLAEGAEPKIQIEVQMFKIKNEC